MQSQVSYGNKGAGIPIAVRFWYNKRKNGLGIGKFVISFGKSANFTPGLLIFLAK